jgi:23S rRNA pseudouridine2604 synthase
MTRSTLKLPPVIAPAKPPKPPTSRARRAQHDRTPRIASRAIAAEAGISPRLTPTGAAPSAVMHSGVVPSSAAVKRAAGAAAPVTAMRAAPAPAPAPTHEHPRLSKRMSELGLCSRREADEWIENGWVKVDGVVMTTLGTRVPPTARIEIDDAAQKHQSEQVTILLNKPIGYVSGQAEDGYQPASVLLRAETRWAEDRAPLKFKASHLRGLAPAGRLDIDSTGLIVFTQDGRVARRLIGRDSEVEKEYLVRVEGTLSPSGMSLLQHGLELDGVKLKPARVSWQNEHQLRFVLREGRKRQIRRMCELVGLVVTGLKRVRTGSVALGKLPTGQWRYLRADEKF